jgi:hypothetical protein
VSNDADFLGVNQIEHRSGLLNPERKIKIGWRRLFGTSAKTDQVHREHFIGTSEPDPEVAMGQERSLFTLANLLDLVSLVDKLSSRGGVEGNKPP